MSCLREWLLPLALTVSFAACEPDEEAPPSLVETVPANGAQGIDPDATVEVSFVFDQPMDTARGDALLKYGAVEQPLALTWRDGDKRAVVPVAGLLPYGAEVHVHLREVAGKNGLAPETTSLSFQTGSDHRAPQLLHSSPAHGATEVYPAEVHNGTQEHVKLSFTFDEDMDTSAASITIRAQGQPDATIEGTWSADGRTLVAMVQSNPLLGGPPLLDETVYEVGPGTLVDLAGNSPVLELSFTTGRCDPLLNHSCGHVTFGPYGSVTAATAATSSTPRSDTGHTRYTVQLPVSANGYAGFTRMRLVRTGNYHLFLDGDFALTVLDEGLTPLTADRSATPAACDGITHRVSFEGTQDDTVFLQLGPHTQPEVRFIVEVEGD